MRQSPKALCFTPVASFKNKDVAFCFSRLCMQYKLFYIWLQEENARHEEKKRRRKAPTKVYIYPTSRITVQQVNVKFKVLSFVRHAFVKALIYTFHDMMTVRAG